jgi:hypothetical protein
MASASGHVLDAGRAANRRNVNGAQRARVTCRTRSQKRCPGRRIDRGAFRDGVRSYLAAARILLATSMASPNET